MTQQQGGQPLPWQPANTTEERLLAALRADDRTGFFAILASVPLLLPLSSDDPARPPTADPEYFVTYTIGDATYLLLFTSEEALRATVGTVVDGYLETDYTELRAALGDGSVLVAFNLGTPIDAWMDVDSVARAAAGEVIVPTGPEMAELLQVRDPDNAEAVERAAVVETANFVQDYLDGLLTGPVLVATGRPTAAVHGDVPAGFPWRIGSADGAATVEAFSGPEYVPEGTHTTLVPFAALVAGWPAGAQLLSVNPGTPVGFRLPAEALEAFAASAPPVFDVPPIDPP